MSEFIDEGATAYADGEDPEDCPYADNTSKRHEWLIGWKNALLADASIDEDVRAELLKKADAARS